MSVIISTRLNASGITHLLHPGSTQARRCRSSSSVNQSFPPSSSSSPSSSSGSTRPPHNKKKPKPEPGSSRTTARQSLNLPPNQLFSPSNHVPMPNPPSQHAPSFPLQTSILPSSDDPIPAWRPKPSPQLLDLTSKTPKRPLSQLPTSRSSPSNLPQPQTSFTVSKLPPLNYTRDQILRLATEYKDTSQMLKANAPFAKIERAVYKHRNRQREGQGLTRKIAKEMGKDEGFQSLQGIMGVPIISTRPVPIEYTERDDAPCALPHRPWREKRQALFAEKRKRVREGKTSNLNPLFDVKFPLEIKFRVSHGIGGKTAFGHLDPSTLAERHSHLPTIFRPSFPTTTTSNNQSPILFRMEASPPPAHLAHSYPPERRSLRPQEPTEAATAGHLAALRHESSPAYVAELQALLSAQNADPELVARVMEIVQNKREKLGLVPPPVVKEEDGREIVTIGVETSVGKKSTHALATARNKCKRKVKEALRMAICLEHYRVLLGEQPRFEWRDWQYKLHCTGYPRWTKMESIVEQITKCLIKLATSGGSGRTPSAEVRSKGHGKRL